jgi:sec-independent protein translocase protein TatC
MAVADRNDDIDQTKAPLLEHLIELRRRVIYCVAAVCASFIVCYIFSNHIYNFLLIPYKLAVGGENPHIKLIYTALEGKFVTDVRVAFFGAIALSFPVLASQLYMFVAPGLYRNERKAFLPFLIATPVLFLIGGSIVFFVVMPLAVRFFLSMQQTGDIEIEALPDVGNYLHLTMTFILAFGLCFQLPVLLTLLARAGIITSQWLREQWRYAIVLIFVVAAVLAPPDVPSQIALAIPTLLLYELSILAVKLVERQRAGGGNSTGSTSSE